MEIKTDLQVAGTPIFGNIPTLPSSNPTADDEAARKTYADFTGCPYHILGLKVWAPEDHKVYSKFKHCALTNAMAGGEWMYTPDSDSSTLDLSSIGSVGIVNGCRSVLSPNNLYYLYYMSDASGDNRGRWVDTSRTSPAFPSGYPYRRLLSAFYTDNSGNIIRFNQVNRWVYFGYRDVLVNGGATTWTSVNYANVVPDSAMNILFQYCTSSTGGSGGQVFIGPHSGTYFYVAGGPGYYNNNYGQLIMHRTSNNTLWYTWNGYAYGKLMLQVAGFELELRMQY